MSFMKWCARNSLRRTRRATPLTPAFRPGAEWLEDRLVPATYWVTTSNDDALLTPPGSLRWAINEANFNDNRFNTPANSPDVIKFKIGNGDQVIAVDSNNTRAGLPPIYDAVIVDATPPTEYTQQRVVLDGDDNKNTAGRNANGLEFNNSGGRSSYPNPDGGSKVWGLTIRDFGGSGVAIFNSSNVSVGGSDLNQGNRLVTNDYAGVRMSTSNSALGVQNNRVVGNLIGTTGTVDAGNGYGVVLEGYNSLTKNNVIGGPNAADRNLIAYNKNDGIWINTADNTTIAGNFIGNLDSGRMQAAGNKEFGVHVSAGSKGTMIGGTATVDANGMITRASNVISGNVKSGILLDGFTFTPQTGTKILGNFVGVGEDGVTKLPNDHGIAALNAKDIPIGDGTDKGRNVISGNTRDGIFGSNCEGFQIIGNYIGVGRDKTTKAGNGGWGINFTGTSKNNREERNEIRFNKAGGVHAFLDGGATGDALVVVQNNISDNEGDGFQAEIGNLGGNPVGLTLTQNTVTGNLGSGVALLATETQTVAGSGATVNLNDILSNQVYGILIRSGGSHTIANNDVSGNQSDGIHMDTFAAFNTISADMIQGNQGAGVRIEQSGPGNSVLTSVVTGNATDGVYAEAGALEDVTLNLSVANCTIQGNAEDGIQIVASGPPLTYPDPAYGVSITGNSIAGHGGDGVHITGGGASTLALNSITGNDHGVLWDGGSRYNQLSGGSIYQNYGAGLAYLDPVGNKSNGTTYDQNGGLGIDFGDDGVTGPLPVIEWAKRDMLTNHVIVKGHLTWLPNVTYGIEIFGNYSPDPTGFGEGLEVVGGASVTTNGSGYGTFRVDVGDIPYPFVSATATGPGDDMRTSEFAYKEEVVPAPMTISGTVWDDGWAQPYINLYYDGNGLQDPGSQGIGNLTVLLFDDQGNQVASTTTSMYPSPTQGNYSFNVEPGTYRVQFFLPQGDELTSYNFSPKDAGPDDVDSDAYVDTGFTDFVTLDLGDSADFDAGIFTTNDTLPGGGGP